VYWAEIDVTVPVTVPPVNVTAPVLTLIAFTRIPLTRLADGRVMTVALAEFMTIVLPAKMSATVTV
jgi:hypothetical protein